MEHKQDRRHSTKDNTFHDHAAWLELTTALDWLPLPSLVLASDGLALAANKAWAVLSAAPAEVARGEGWLGVVDPADREPLRARLCEAATVGEVGDADFRLADLAGGRRSRWWWRSGPVGRLLVCVADLDAHQPHGDNGWRQVHGPHVRLVRRSEFVTLVGRALRRSRCNGTYVAVVAVSLDGAADAGHAAGQPDGNTVLQAVAERILGTVGAAGAVALGDRDQFVILCGDLQNPRDAAVAASRVCDAVAQPLEVGGEGIRIAAATGFTLASSPSETAEALIARACLSVRSVRMDQQAGSPVPGRAASPKVVTPAADRGARSQTSACSPPGLAVNANTGHDLAGLAVQRLFGVGLILQSAAGLAEAPVAKRLQQAVDELDAIIREVRTAAFKLQHPGHPQD